jgi:hypothetical protein
MIESLPRQFDQIKLSLSVQTEVITLSEMNLRPALSSPHFIPLDKSQIHDSLFISEVVCPLDEHVSIDIAQSGITVTVIICAPCRKGQRNTENPKNQNQHCFFHLRPPGRGNANSMPTFLPLKGKANLSLEKDRCLQIGSEKGTGGEEKQSKKKGPSRGTGPFHSVSYLSPPTPREPHGSASLRSTGISSHTSLPPGSAVHCRSSTHLKMAEH